MSVELEHLLHKAAGDPGPPSDADEIWRKGRQRRRRRILGASATGVVVVALLAVLPLSIGGDLQPVVEPVGQDGSAEDDTSGEGAEEDGAEDSAADGAEDSAAEPGISDERAAELEALQQQQLDRMRDAVEERERRLEEAREAEDEAEAEDEGQQEVVTAEPDAARMADPCEIHEGREMRVFIDVVSPVEGQEVGSQIELVGCASVYEGTVQYRVVDGSDDVVLEDFTTATMGGPEIGEFRETIDLPVSGNGHYLEVYWEDASSGSERDLVRIALGPQ